MLMLNRREAATESLRSFQPERNDFLTIPEGHKHMEYPADPRRNLQILVEPL